MSATEGVARRLSKIKGNISHAKGLHNNKVMSKMWSFCVVKGILGNSHLVELYKTDVQEGGAPEWNEDWEFDCLAAGCTTDFVGIKYSVFDGDDFLGGSDVDISEINAFRVVEEELELSGLVQPKNQKTAVKKGRIYISFAIERTLHPIPERPREALLSSMVSFTRVTGLKGRIIRARGTTGKKYSLPMCFCRCIMMSGKVVRLYNTDVAENVKEPYWDELFEYDFDEGDEPVMIVFDVWGTYGGPPYARDILKAGDLLGSAQVPVDSVLDYELAESETGRFKLPLHGVYQLLEQKCNQKGRLDQVKVQYLDGHREGNPVFSKFSQTMKRNRENAKLIVELFAVREERQMKHSELLEDDIVIEENEIADNPDPELEMYFAEEGVNRLLVTSEERVRVIYGRVKKATDLVSTDVMGKSDPYCIVEAQAKTGETLFLHRTRAIQNTLNPSWDEAFFFVVPDDPNDPRLVLDVSTLVFSIWDTDEGQMETLGKNLALDDAGDDFLGRCVVDIVNMRNCDKMDEDVPILGVKARPGGFKGQGSGFRRYSSLHVEVRVERRVKRIVGTDTHIDPQLLWCPRHHETRQMLPPKVRGYKDHGQEPMKGAPKEYLTAGQVLALRESGTLMEHVQTLRDKGVVMGGFSWAKIPHPKTWVPKTHKGDEDDEKDPDSPKESPRVKWHTHKQDDDIGSDPGALLSPRRSNVFGNWRKTLQKSQQSLYDLDHVDRLPPMKRTGSEPRLATLFGHRYEELTADPFVDRLKLKPPCPKWDENVGIKLVQATAARLRAKPPLSHYTMHRESIM